MIEKVLSHVIFLIYSRSDRPAARVASLAGEKRGELAPSLVTQVLHLLLLFIVKQNISANHSRPVDVLLMNTGLVQRIFRMFEMR